MEERIGFIGIVVENRNSVPAVNAILSEAADCIRGRLGVPDPRHGVSVITLVVFASTDRVGAITGRLGRLQGVRVKSAMTAVTSEQKGNAL